MKKNNILLGLISLLCVGTAAGCGGGGGDPTYEIKATTANYEDGIVIGGGKYKNGETVELKFYPVDGCYNPSVSFYPEGETESTKEYKVGTEAGDIKLSADGKHYTLSIVVNDGVVDPKAKNSGTYSASFKCYQNSAAELANKTIAEYDVNFKVVKVVDNTGEYTIKEDSKVYDSEDKEVANYNTTDKKITFTSGGEYTINADNKLIDANGGEVGSYDLENSKISITSADTKNYAYKYDSGSQQGNEVTLEKQVKKYNEKLKEIRYIDHVDGIVEWYVADSNGNASETKYDFSKPVMNELNLVGVVTKTSDEAIVEDAITNLKATNKLIITDGNNNDATVLGLNEGFEKLYFHNDKSIISDNTYYKIKTRSGQDTLYYKLPLGIDKSGFEIKDIKDVYDYLEVSLLTFSEEDTYEVAYKGSNENVDILSNRGSYDNNTKKITIGDFTYTIDDTKTVVKDANGAVGAYADNAFTVENFSYRIDGTKVYDSEDKEVGSYDNGTIKIGENYYTIDSTKRVVVYDSGVVGEYNSNDKIVTFNNVNANVANKSYKIVGEKVRLFVDTVDCRIYTVKKDGKAYMDLYINKGYIYKTVRYNSDGTAVDVSNVFEYTTDSVAKTTPKTIYDMNLIKFLDASISGEQTSELNTALEEINESFDDILKNVAIELKSLDTLIKENEKLNNILRKYDYEVYGDNTSTTLVYVDQTLPVSSTNFVKNLYIKVNASYDTVQAVIDELQTGNFTVTTTTKVFGDEVVSKTYEMAAGTDVLNIDMASLPTGMNKIIAETLVKLNTLENYARFEYSQEDAGKVTEKNIYKFYDNEDDSVPYITVTLDKDNKLVEVTYYDLSNANVNERNTYISTFTFPSAE